VKVVVVAGMYKIWPASFYYRNYRVLEVKDSVGSPNATMSSADIDFILTERALLTPDQFMQDPVTRAYLKSGRFAVKCALSVSSREQLPRALKVIGQDDAVEIAQMRQIADRVMADQVRARFDSPAMALLRRLAERSDQTSPSQLDRDELVLLSYLAAAQFIQLIDADIVLTTAGREAAKSVNA